MPVHHDMPDPRPRVWIVTEAADAAARDVAVRTLRHRLEAVWSELRGACGARQAPERIHQLRVATRRSLAAIDAFEDLLPTRSRAWFAKWLRRIRRAAGDARDLDVLTDRLGDAAVEVVTTCRSTAGRTARRRLVAMLARQRTASRRPVYEIREKLLAADWPGRVERLLDRVGRGRPGPPFARYARRRLRPLAGRFFARADRRLREADEIHRLRIEGKKLRYAIEIFAPVFPSRLVSRCQKALESLQEHLGEFTDHAAAAERLERWSRRQTDADDRTEIRELRKAEESRAQRARKTFTKWWSPTRRRSLRRRVERTLRRGTA